VPRVVVSELHTQADGLVWNFRAVEFRQSAVHARLELAAKQVHPHDAEDEPEHQAD